MPTRILNLISANRRDKLFAEIRHLINEVDAQDRSLERCGEGMAIDETLEEICGLLRREGKRAKKTRAAIAA
ncbi:MAG: hypothetical protein WCT04_25095 [Planctomycetota bacterium]